MASLQVRGPDYSATKQKAFEDAKKMQKAVIEACNKSGKEIPQYQLSELIGKGSFGRVYKAKSLASGRLVAVKIIDIEESDTVNPKLADTYSDLLKEINALQRLSDSGARNINHVLEALPVGQSMWMVTEYCAGGSVATLMRPTAPGGLQEKWIIPILREVAEAIHWVHSQGIIHRDLKCANVLITEVGDVQLCDFGVAGVIETKFDKRTTFIGTPHWMAPELFDEQASYGTEVDIWAFGSMMYEIASGLPPNVAFGMDFSKLGTHLKQHSPRLEGEYSTGLKDLVAYCLQHDSSKRPTIEQIQRHRYISNTEKEYPTTGLAHLVKAFKLWEAQGGDRRSLFSAGGAQGLADLSPAAMANEEWSFSTTAAFDQQVLNDGDAQDVYDVYGSDVDYSQTEFETTKPQKPKSRRRPPPQHLAAFKAPLEKVFDPNTLSNYEDNSRAYYGRMFQPPPQQPATGIVGNGSDLPLRDDSAQATDVRESLIDLDVSLHGSDLSQFVDMTTMRAGETRPGDSRASLDYEFIDSHYTQGPLSDPADLSANNRRTQDWKFPSMAAPPASANPEVFRFPFHNTPPAPDSAGGRPALLHRPTEPVLPSAGFHDMAAGAATHGHFDNRASVGSLIDLDMSFADPVIASADGTRPSTSHSDVGSMSGSEMGGANNPFELEKHASLYAVMPGGSTREPSIYVSDGSEFSFTGGHESITTVDGFSLHKRDISVSSDQPPAAAPGAVAANARPYSLSDFADTDPESATPPPQTALVRPRQANGFPSASFQPQNQPQQPQLQQQQRSLSESSSTDSAAAGLPALPEAPAPQVLQGQADADAVKRELRRMAMSLGEHLNFANNYLSGLPIRRGSTIRTESYAEES
ncbi:serine/threonine protein kinase [Cordyceps fumosorosea ARSEF 2679]|uniref:non-specific serine/threonine protein kinase n=1 Tax=Cordyceps fumosorosea (strain ARSEF 2679) TaxID=1081104 RepID=A0A167ZJP3_CORFA|nr:serine/threonine protein kinase [Cordyceps fumosorosea ARSEF 2679]OAA67598.1 serine/threonine protein kinase [Cordyceps fumosorosea ARSEF 2679]